MWYVLMACAMKFDFIEIGTSNFNTLLQSNAGLGLSVEALKVRYKSPEDFHTHYCRRHV